MADTDVVAAVSADRALRSDRKYRPLFVLAPARSGSSVVAAMLGQHPQLYGFPELRLFRGTTVAELLVDPPPGSGMPARERTAGLVRSLAQLHENRQSAQAAERAFEWLRARAAWDVAAVFDHLMALVAPLVAVEKSPETSLTDDALQRVSQAYPEARYLHLVRHPWATVSSMINAWGGLDYWQVSAGAAPQFCLNIWREQHQRILAFGRRVGRQRFTRVRAEDVINHPGDVLPSLCDWLDIDGGDASVGAMLCPERSCYATAGPRNACGGFDPKFLARPALRQLALPRSLTPPADWAIAQRALIAAMDLAGQFGYEDDRAQSNDGGIGLATRPGRDRRFARSGPAIVADGVEATVRNRPQPMHAIPALPRAAWRRLGMTAAPLAEMPGEVRELPHPRPDHVRVWPGATAAGATVWFTGLPAAGKTSVATEVARRLLDAGRAAVVLDGDELRHGFSADLGFSATDRNEHVRRVADLALSHAASGTVALVALVSPYRRAREHARDRHRGAGLEFFEIHVDTPLGECERRDPKGLYRRARAGQAPNVTGIDDPYEPPVNPDLHLTPDDGDIRAQAAMVCRLLTDTVRGEG